MKFGIFVFLVAFAAYGNCADVVGLGADVFGHAVPVKCTINCETDGPSVGPVVPSPLVHILSGAGPFAPSDPPATPAVVEAPVVPALPLYHPAPYGHYLGAWNHGLLAHPALYGHPGYLAHGHGFYATGPVDVNADGVNTYTGPEDDLSPIAGGHVYSGFEGATKWHGLYGAPAHFPVGPYHHVASYAHYPWGYWGHPGVPHGKVPEEAEHNGPLYPYGHLTNWAPHHPLAYTGAHVAALGLKPEDCPDGILPHLPHLPIVFDKSTKAVEDEAVAVTDAVPEAAPAE